MKRRPSNFAAHKVQQELVKHGGDLFWPVGRTSKYVGVSWRRNDRRWAATVCYLGKQYKIGCYQTEAEAADAVYRFRKAHPKMDQTRSQAGSYPRANVSSKYKGVSKINKWNNSWRMSLTYKRKQYYCNFATEREAAIAYDIKKIELTGSDYGTNRYFFEELRDVEKETIKKIKHRLSHPIRGISEVWSRIVSDRPKIANTSSKYVGVSKRKRSLLYSPFCWAASIRQKGKTYSLGQYETEIEAAIAYDAKKIELYGPNSVTNAQRYPADFKNIDKNLIQKVKEKQSKKPVATTSKYIGVNRISKENLKTRKIWFAAIKYKERTIYLGSYESELEAARKYDAAKIGLCGPSSKTNAKLFPEDFK